MIHPILVVHMGSPAYHAYCTSRNQDKFYRMPTTMSFIFHTFQDEVYTCRMPGFDSTWDADTYIYNYKKTKRFTTAASTLKGKVCSQKNIYPILAIMFKVCTKSCSVKCTIFQYNGPCGGRTYPLLIHGSVPVYTIQYIYYTTTL